VLALYHFLSPSKPASPRRQLNKGVSQALLRVNCPLKPSAQASIAANRMPSMAALAPSIHRLAAGYVRLDRSMEKASATII